MFKIIILFLIQLSIFAQTIPEAAKKLIKAYPNQSLVYENNEIIFSDGSRMIFDDKKVKSFQELLDSPDIEDQFKIKYSKALKKIKPKKNQDPGRIRNTEFFSKIYGNTKAKVEENLEEIYWCPKLVNQKIKVTKINGIDKILIKLSNELDQHPEYQAYLKNIAGTFDWRNIAGTNRLSMHSFGMTMDINLEKTNYWQCDCKCQNEDAKLGYKNKIPLGLVDIFEKYGFIWGGKWYHYDTMHFEYRPELL